MTIGELIKYERCEFWLYNCPFTNSTGDCVNHFCNGKPQDFGSCAEDFPKAGSCCNQTDAASCLRDYQQSLGVDHDGACATVRSVLAKCESVSGFATLAPQTQASCVCYNNIGNYIPSVWDNAATSCYASGSSAHPALYSILAESSSEAVGFCTKYAGPAAASATATGTASETTTTAGAVASTATSFTTATGTSSSPTATTTKSSSGTKINAIDKKFLVTGLFLLMPAIIMATI